MMPALTPDEEHEYGEKIKALCELESGLSDWELQFVEDMANKLKEKTLSGYHFLTTAQKEKINGIYESHC